MVAIFKTGGGFDAIAQKRASEGHKVHVVILGAAKIKMTADAIEEVESAGWRLDHVAAGEGQATMPTVVLLF